MPQKMLMSVVLPAAMGTRSAKISPCGCRGDFFAPGGRRVGLGQGEIRSMVAWRRTLSCRHARREMRGKQLSAAGASCVAGELAPRTDETMRYPIEVESGLAVIVQRPVAKRVLEDSHTHGGPMSSRQVIIPGSDFSSPITRAPGPPEIFAAGATSPRTSLRY